MSKTFNKFLGSITVLAMALNASAFAGGVSDGGGGTTNPRPTDPERVVSAVRDYAAPMLLMWLNAQEASFQMLNEEAQAKSPLFKLFKSEKSIFDIVRETQVELRMSEPCYDKNGTPWDGSIYADKLNAICISPFTMAPKLNDRNVEEETFALLVHELSHLVGTTEDEARAIQDEAIGAFSTMDALDTVVKLDLLASNDVAGRIPLLVTMLNIAPYQHSSDFGSIIDRIIQLRDDLVIQLFKATAVRKPTLDRFMPEHMRELVILNSICAADQREDAELRKYCSDWIEKAFAGNTVASAREIAVRMDYPVYYDTLFSSLLISKPSTPSELWTEVHQLEKFLIDVHNEAAAVTKAKINAYRKR